MPRHSSPPPSLIILSSRTSTSPEPLPNPIPTPRGRSPRSARRGHSGGLPADVALAAVVLGAASIGLPATAAFDSSSAATDISQVLTALTEGQAETPSREPVVATSQVLTVHAPARPVIPNAGADVQSLRKANDRTRRVTQQPREASSAREAEPTAGRATTVRGGFARPVTGRVTSSYGSRSGGTHYGLDVANRIGAPIRAAASGTVISAGPASGFGLWVRIRHDNGTVTVYGHINRALVDVGQDVDAGEVIAEVGNRGQSTGPHLHFEAQSAGGEKLNPARWLDQRGVGF